MPEQLWTDTYYVGLVKFEVLLNQECIILICPKITAELKVTNVTESAGLECPTQPDLQK